MRGLFSTRTSQLSGNAPRRMIQRILLIAPTISSLRILVWPILLTPPNRVLPPVDRKNVNVGHMLLHLRAGQASYDARRRRYSPHQFSSISSTTALPWRDHPSGCVLCGEHSAIVPNPLWAAHPCRAARAGHRPGLHRWDAADAADSEKAPRGRPSRQLARAEEDARLRISCPAQLRPRMAAVAIDGGRSRCSALSHRFPQCSLEFRVWRRGPPLSPKLSRLASQGCMTEIDLARMARNRGLSGLVAEAANFAGDFRKEWCPGEDSNLHGLAATGT